MMFTHTIVIDRRNAPIVKEAFGLYAKGDQRLEDIAEFLKSKDVLSKSGKNSTPR